MLNYAIIGFGRAGKIHYNTIINNYSSQINIKYIIETNLSSLVNNNDIKESIIYSNNIEDALLCTDVQCVIICSPTYTHYEIVKLCLNHNKNIFIEKPLANNSEQIQELYNLASQKQKILFTALNRRLDNQFINAKEHLENKTYGIPLSISVICRDYPFPSEFFLNTCNGIIRDCVIHDLDSLCYIMNTKIKEVDAKVESNELNSNIIITFENNVRASLIHSRYADSYDQRVNIICETGTIQVTNPITENHPDYPISFNYRYNESYINQMKSFINLVNDKIFNFTPNQHNILFNVTLEEALHIENVIEKCIESNNKKVPIKINETNVTNVTNVTKTILNMDHIQ